MDGMRRAGGYGFPMVEIHHFNAELDIPLSSPFNAITVAGL
jgi:hypothetical protein